MQFLEFPARSIFYHGSSRIHQINCYARNNVEILTNYLSQLILETPVPRIPNKVVKQFSTLYYEYKTPLFDSDPISKEVLYIMTLKLLLRRNIRCSVRKAMKKMIHEYGEDSLQLLDFASEVEEKRDITLFEVKFYSSMKSPLQYFSEDYEVAGIYYRRKLEYGGILYQYVLRTPIKLLDINDRSTFEALASSVYSSNEPIPDEVIEYYTGYKDKSYYRTQMLRDFLYFDGDFKRLDGNLALICTRTDAELPESDTDRLFEYDNWFKYFKEDVLTPVNLWYITGSMFPTRYTTYETDALLLGYLVDYMANNKVDYMGIVSHENSELVIVHPEKYGSMTPVLISPNATCKYARVKVD